MNYTAPASRTEATSKPANRTLLNQVLELECQAATLASEGFDVTEASKKLDELRNQLKTRKVCDEAQMDSIKGTEGGGASDYVQVTEVQVNLMLNQARVILAHAEGKRRFLRSPWPVLMFFYEFLVLIFWGVLIGIFHSFIYRNYIEPSTWPLLLSLAPAAAAGSIASSSYALMSLYRHIVNRSLDAGLSTWYIIKPVVGGIAGSFVGLIGSVVLHVVGASGNSAHAVFLGVAYLGGVNPEFTENLTSQFSQRVLGGRV